MVLGASVAIITVFLLALLVIRNWPWLFGSKPSFRSDAPAVIDVSVIDWAQIEPALRNNAYSKTIDSSSACVKILKVIAGAQKSIEHQCLTAGKITIHYSDGVSVQLGFLPGHHTSRYEFRYNGALYSMPRSQFLDVMQSVGVEKSQLPQK